MNNVPFNINAQQFLYKDTYCVLSPFMALPNKLQPNQNR